jgi:hypothetical protein
MFQSIFGNTPFFSSSGWNVTNCWGVIESGACGALAIGRYFLSTPEIGSSKVSISFLSFCPLPSLFPLPSLLLQLVFLNVLFFGFVYFCVSYSEAYP